MIQIKPKLEYESKCPNCSESIKSGEVVWQGIHVCVRSECSSCKKEYVEDLPIGHAIYSSYKVDLESYETFGGKEKFWGWFGKPFLDSLKNPTKEDVNFEVKKNKNVKNAVILNCIDYLYGHSLLKLFNTQELLNKKNNNLGVVVIVPKFLSWLVPSGVAETWIVDLPLNRSQEFFTKLNKKINKEVERLDKVYLSTADPHPKDFDISYFTKVKKHNLNSKSYRVTFVWREDRPWFSNDYVAYAFAKLGILQPLLWIQNLKIRFLFWVLRRKMKGVKFTVAGVGKSTTFPQWIEDIRFEKPKKGEEKKLCKTYSESRVVVGVHGSSLLLPSGHAGMVISLLPNLRLGNITQDMIYEKQENPHFISFKYRFLPININITTLSNIVASMVRDHASLKRYFGRNEK